MICWYYQAFCLIYHYQITKCTQKEWPETIKTIKILLNCLCIIAGTSAVRHQLSSPSCSTRAIHIFWRKKEKSGLLAVKEQDGKRKKTRLKIEGHQKGGNYLTALRFKTDKTGTQNERN